MTFLLSTHLFFSGEIYRNLERTGSIEKRIASVVSKLFSIFFPSPSNFVLGASVREASFFGSFYERVEVVIENQANRLHRRRISERKKE